MRRSILLPLAATAGVALAVLVGVAVAATFTLKVARNAKVTNARTHATTRETIVVDSRGFAVYDLSGETIKHPKCTKANGCLAVWPAVTVASVKQLRAQPGIKGRLGVWRRYGFLQVTLAGHPLYTFVADSHKDWATGEDIVHFGGTWHVITASVKRGHAKKRSKRSGGTRTLPGYY
jgi:predicted lipoprotein with Yx(FWY)xxD motif